MVEKQTVEREYTPALGHHCTCEECQEWEEDVAHELATLRARLDERDSSSRNGSVPNASDSKPTSGQDSMPVPESARAEAPQGETVVKPTEEIQPKKTEKKYAGWLV